MAVLLATIDIKYGQAGLSKTTLEIYLRFFNTLGLVKSFVEKTLGSKKIVSLEKNESKQNLNLKFSGQFFVIKIICWINLVS